MSEALQKFLQANMQAREAEVKVSPPEAVQWFGKAWTVRGLTAAELARAREAGERHESVKALISAMAGDGSDKAKALRDAMGLSEEQVPADISRRIEMLTYGSVEPRLGADLREVSVKVAESFPTLFYELTNRILELTGSGAEPGKRKRSTPTQASE
jgi:hypothetical protein